MHISVFANVLEKFYGKDIINHYDTEELEVMVLGLEDIELLFNKKNIVISITNIDTHMKAVAVSVNQELYSSVVQKPDL